MKKLSLQEVEYLAHSLAKALMNYDEPLPDFSTRYPGKLESCLEQPFQTFGGDDLYPALVDKAATIFYLVTKNHPFENGNKRMAVSIALTFLYVNNHWVRIDPNTLYQIALKVAESKPDQKDDIIKLIKELFERFLEVR